MYLVESKNLSCLQLGNGCELPGPAKVFTYQPRLGETTTLELDVPKQFWSFVRSVRDGKKFVGKKIHMDDNSYLEMGNRVTVNMEDAEGGSTATTFPSLEFRTSDEKGGEVYQLDWQAFAQERKLARGAWDEDWGLSKVWKSYSGWCFNV